MALQLHVSNALNDLANHFCNELNNQPKVVFQPTYIITQTEGMNTWLKYRIVDHLGIAANYRYVKSQDIINQVYFLLGGKSAETLSASSISWVLFKLLGEQQFKQTYPKIAAYFAAISPDNDLKRMALAEKIADLFDQYQIYRADMIEEWNQQLNIEKMEDWQQFLWKKSKLLLAEKLPDKTNVSQYIIEQLKDTAQQQKLVARMPVIYLFGLSITTSYHLQLYHAIGEWVQVNFYLVNPAPSQYWFEDISEKQWAVLQRKGFANDANQPIGNPLLTSWGKVLQDTYGLLFQDEALLNSYNEVGMVTPTDNTLLHKIQSDVFLNSKEISLMDMADCLDGSITINACYGPAREVEVLYNYLVQLVDKQQKKISPRDIVVMITDINAYAPYIKAIFDNAPYKFRYSITDESLVNGDTISAALQSLLSVSEETFTSENVLQLLDSSFVRKRFGITDTPLIRDVINKANIRFGTKNSQADESVYVSWTYGLQRVMYGICMSGEDEYGTGATSFYPLDIVEGNASEQIIRFNHFVQVLMDTIKKTKEERTIYDWVVFVQSILDNFIFEPDETTNDEYLLLINQLEAYNDINEYFSEKVSFMVFAHSFLQMLGGSTTAASFATAGITFCSLIPMRSIPFKIVAMLGMNFDKFPRRDNPVSFNLMERKKRKGDRTIKGNDKHLFLETLVSAQENLYISYVGQSAKDNTTIPPSALIDELIDYIQSGTQDKVDVRKVMVTKHPLHGFSRQYNQQNDRLITYLNVNNKVAANFIDNNKVSPAIYFEDIVLDAMINFFKNPFKGYYNNVLKIYYTDADELLPENEIFELDHLQKWALKQQFLLLDATRIYELKDRLVKTGGLPLKNMATVSLENIEATVIDTKRIFSDCIGQEQASILPIEIKLVNTTINASLTTIYGNKLVVYSFSKNESKYLLDAYIKYLAAIAANVPVSLHYISAIKKQEYIAVPVSREDAVNRLESMVALYKQGHENVLAFYPPFEIKSNKLDDMDMVKFNKMVDDHVTNYNVPCNDAYLLNEYGKGFFDGLEVFKQFKLNCEILLKPLALLFPSYYQK